MLNPPESLTRPFLGGSSGFRNVHERINVMLTTDYAPGKPNWIDLGSPNIEAAAEFYSALFGWQFQSAGPDAGGYGMFVLNGKTVAAIGPLTEQGANSAWTVYFHTSDAEATAQNVAKEGGAVRFGPFDVFDQGRMAGFADPSGAQFAVWQPEKNQGLEAVTLPNTLFWTELHTTDPPTAKAFYRSVFNWAFEDMPMDGFTYTIVRPSDTGQEASQGGVMGINEDMRKAGMQSRWQPYFQVTDCDAVVATATKQGGEALMQPADLEGVGRMAALADPFGAPFSVITPAA